MKNLIGALALVLAASIGFSAQAEQTSLAADVKAEFTADSTSAEMFVAGYTCTTHSRGVTYSSNDFDYRTAERNALNSCLRHGGVEYECRQNLYCVSRDTPGRPPRPRPPHNPPPHHGSYFDWGMGRDGYGYCYEWTWDGRVLNGGRPVSNYNCERVSPSYYGWGTGRDGLTYCYQWTPRNVPMNQGRPVPNNYCY